MRGTAFAKCLSSRAYLTTLRKNATAHSPKKPTFPVERYIPWEVFKPRVNPISEAITGKRRPLFAKSIERPLWEEVNLCSTLHSKNLASI
jgi:hypothetical protein